MAFLLIAILCTTSLNVIFKISEGKNSNRYAVSSFNCLSAMVISYIFVFGQKLFDASWFSALLGEFSHSISSGVKLSTSASPAFAILLAIIAGTISYICIYILQLSTARNGSAMTITFNKVGVMIPAILSVVFFGEVPSSMQIIGVIIAMLSIVMVYFKKEEASIITLKLALFGTLFFGGFSDFLSKIYEYYGTEQFQGLFIFYLYLFSAVLAFIAMMKKNRKIKRSDVIFGLITGVPAQFISQFLLKALTTVPAFIVFPLFSVGAILLVNLINLLVFKEKLSKQQFAAIGMMIVATVFLNI
ncbi:EamA family transporter [Oscillibacter sp.]|uniref:EamA family transporter n=1 Tax=Oscillibacter sp. TaxID=1945593 RepID=UPI003394EEDC